MNLEIPKITVPIRLAEYAPELGDLAFRVWVNPPRNFLLAYDDLVRQERAARHDMAEARAANDEARLARTQADIERVGEEFMNWYVTLWSQHPNPETHVSRDDVYKLISLDTDPALYLWVCAESHVAIARHRAGSKKK